jgi:predicted ArsR family transcriptional regulator
MIPEPDICENRHGGNEQSEAAHASIAPRAGTIRARVRAYIAAHPGATCEQVEIALGLKHQTASARLSELKRDGDIRVTGTRRISSGCSAAKYQTKPQQLGFELVGS